VDALALVVPPRWYLVLWPPKPAPAPMTPETDARAGYATRESTSAAAAGEPRIEIGLAQVAHRPAASARRAATCGNSTRCPSQQRRGMLGSSAKTSSRRLDRAVGERLDQRRLVDDRAARDVDERALAAQRGEGRRRRRGSSSPGHRGRPHQKIGRGRSAFRSGRNDTARPAACAPCTDLHALAPTRCAIALPIAAEARMRRPAGELGRELGPLLSQPPACTKRLRRTKPRRSS